MNLKKTIVGILFLTSFSAIGQNQLLVVVDGFFTNNDSTFVVNYLDDEIKTIEVLSTDFSEELLGKYGKFGVLKIETKNRQSEKSRFFRNVENIFFKDAPKFYLNDQFEESFDPNSIDAKTIEKIEVIHPYDAIIEYGLEMKSGIIKIYTKKE